LVLEGFVQDFFLAHALALELFAAHSLCVVAIAIIR
jgi:hypothetical protein